jgi:hypothetical protein
MGKFKEIVKKKDPKRADSPDIGTDELPLPLPEREPSDSAPTPTNLSLSFQSNEFGGSHLSHTTPDFDDKKKSLENQLMRKPTKPEDPEDLRKKLTDSGRTSGAPFFAYVVCRLSFDAHGRVLRGTRCAERGGERREEADRQRPHRIEGAVQHEAQGLHVRRHRRWGQLRG